MFAGFKNGSFAHGDYRIDYLKGGDGPALLLLHGYPQTRAAWHKVAGPLAENYSLIIPDLPGYGGSAGPDPDADSIAYSKRRTAEVMIALMHSLGYERFLLAGHDRGARVAYRLALDHPSAVARLAILDTIPTLNVWEEMDWHSAIGAFHWPFLAQPAPLPERLIGAEPEHYVGHLLDSWSVHRDALEPDAVAAYLGQFRNPRTVASTCADYRAGATIDVVHDRKDRDEGRKIACPCHVLWARGYQSTQEATPLTVWQDWADDVGETAFECGHFIAEERPDECAAALTAFFT